MNRIAIIGRPGSGKSTLSLFLSEKLNIPVYHLDRYFYVANWIERDYFEFLELQQEIIDQEKWIIDGNNLKSLHRRYERADIIIYFNLPKHLCYWRVFKRRFLNHRNRPDRPVSCSERLHWKFLKYMWSFDDRLNPILNWVRAEYPDAQFIEIKNDTDLQKLKIELPNIS